MIKNLNDTVIAQGAQMANQQLMQQLQMVAPMFKQAEQVIQSKSPPPPISQEIQSAMKIAEMENQRKTMLDKATIGMKGQEMQARQSENQAKMQMEQNQQQFEQYMAQMEKKTSDMQDQLNVQIQLIKNKQDNDQHAQTEILKNNQDNQTNIIVEKLKLMADANAQATQESVSVQSAQTDTMGPLIQALNQNLTTFADMHKTTMDNHAQSLSELQGYLSKR